MYDNTLIFVQSYDDVSDRKFTFQLNPMNREKLVNYINSLIPLPEEKLQLVTGDFEYEEKPKNEFLIHENTLSKETYFLEVGYVRSFLYDNNGNEVTTNIFSAPCFVNDFLSFFRQQPTTENFQTLTHCKLWKMTYETVQKNFHTHPEFREFGRMMLVTNYSLLHERMIGMIKDNAEMRYQKLLSAHPDIFQNVPLKIIASFLGITDTSLSRIRKEITRK
jgi:CRP-like cAMP-binding protein